MSEQLPSMVPSLSEQGVKLAAYGLVGATGAATGAVIGGSLAGEVTNPGAAAERNDLNERANDLRAKVTSEEAALDLLDDWLPRDDPVIVSLQGKITTDNAEITTLTTKANSLHAETVMDPVGMVVGGVVCAAIFIAAGWTTARNSRIRLSRIRR